MDTIQVKLILGSPIKDLSRYEEIRTRINNFRSPSGYNFCDVLEHTKDGHLIVKISFPRFYHSSNAYLLATADCCFLVQHEFCKLLKNDSYLRAVKEIELQRVDIPFTYLMEEKEEFSHYENVFRILAKVGEIINKNSSGKGTCNLRTNKYESLVFSDTKCPSSYNKKVIIYNQYENMKAKNSIGDLNTLVIEFEDLKRRIRIEASKKIKRKPFTLWEDPDLICFGAFNIYKEYIGEFKRFILEELLNEEIIAEVLDDEGAKLEENLKIELEKNSFTYEKFILANIENIYDYKVIRSVLDIVIKNDKTREGAVTAIRKALKLYEARNGTMVLSTLKKIKEFRQLVIETRE